MGVLAGSRAQPGATVCEGVARGGDGRWGGWLPQARTGSSATQRGPGRAKTAERKPSRVVRGAFRAEAGSERSPDSIRRGDDRRRNRCRLKQNHVGAPGSTPRSPCQDEETSYGHLPRGAVIRCRCKPQCFIHIYDKHARVSCAALTDRRRVSGGERATRCDYRIRACRTCRASTHESP